MIQSRKFNDKFKLKPLAVALLLGVSGPLFAVDGTVKPNGFGLVSADGDSSINLTGMVHFDARNVSSGLASTPDKDSASVASTFEFRRVRLGVNGSVYKNVDYEVIVNATGSDTNILDTGFLNFSANKDAQIRVGRFRQPYSLEAMTKDASIDFMERSYGDQLGPNKLLGAMVFGEPRKGFTYGLAVSQAGFNELTNSDNLGGLATGRVTFNLAELQNLDKQVFHIGASTNRGHYEVIPTTSTDTGNNLTDASGGFVKQSTTRATLLTYRTEDRGLANAYRVQLGGDIVGAGYGVSGNNAAKVNKSLNDFEWAYAYGPVKVQAEQSTMQLGATAKASSAAGGAATNTASLDVSTKTNYLELVYNVTGEDWSDAYKNGSFTGIKPKSNYVFGSSAGTGAWQLGVRASKYAASLTPKSSITDGANNTSRAENAESARTFTYGVNWIINPSTAVKLNYAETVFNRPVTYLSTTPSGSTTEKERVVSIRTQINF